MVKAASTADEVVAEAALTADEVAAEAAVVAQAASMTNEVVAELHPQQTRSWPRLRSRRTRSWLRLRPRWTRLWPRSHDRGCAHGGQACGRVLEKKRRFFGSARPRSTGAERGEAETRTPHCAHAAAHTTDGVHTFTDGVRKCSVWRARPRRSSSGPFSRALPLAVAEASATAMAVAEASATATATAAPEAAAPATTAATAAAAC